MEKIIIPTEGVQGNITDCRIETTLIGVDKEWAGSTTQINTYRSYDVCTKTVVRDYSVQEVTGVGMFYGLLVAGVVLCVLGALFSSLDSDLRFPKY